MSPCWSVGRGRLSGRPAGWEPSRPSRRRRRLPRSVRPVRLVITLIGLSAVAVNTSCGDTPAPQNPALAADLDSLVADNGLYARPVAAATVPDVADTGYGYRILVAAGRRPDSPWGAGAGADLAATSLSANSIWGPWFVVGAGGPASQLSSRVIASLHPDGSFSDSADTRPDNASRLASTAAALEVLSATGVPLGSGRRAAIGRWVASMSPRVDNPYQACNAIEALRRLGLPVADSLRTRNFESWRAVGHLPASVRSYEDALDLYGVACVEANRSTSVPTTTEDAAAAAQAKAAVGAALRQPQRDFAATYHLVRAWQLLHGDPNSIEAAADLVESSRDRRTGLVSRPVDRIGTLDDSYAVVRICRLAGISERDERIPAGVHLSLDGRCQVVSAPPAWIRSSLSFSVGFFQWRVSRGLPLSWAATASRSAWECTDRSVPLGKYWRSSPLVFSLLPRCHGQCGSQK